MKKIKVGFIGLGLMGLPMAKNILKKKYPLITWSRSKKNYKKIQKEWDNKYNGLIEKVEGDEWHAGNLSYHLKSRPKWFYWDSKFVLPLFEDNYADMVFEENNSRTRIIGKK